MPSSFNSLNVEKTLMSPNVLKTKNNVIINIQTDKNKKIKKAISEYKRFIKKNGIMFVATLNKTLKSYAFAIIGAEYVLKWLPIGTHDWEKFVKPSELINITKKNNLSLKKLDGMNFNILDNSWKVSNDTSVNYITKFIKN